ncbi:MAG TPA: hypothetical protein VFD80_00530 [Flavobacteriaceae bacterium]|nr:hypothetical protein [Flavobacteriaceae bacterium]
MEPITKKGKQIALISYLTFIGLFIAYFMNRDERSAFATFHIKMMFGWVLLLFISQVSYQYIHLIAGDVIWLLSFIGWVLSFVSAVQEKRIVIPFLTENFQKWFRFLE